VSLRCVLPVFPPYGAFPVFPPCNILTQFTSSTSCFQFERYRKARATLETVCPQTVLSQVHGLWCLTGVRTLSDTSGARQNCPRARQTVPDNYVYGLSGALKNRLHRAHRSKFSEAKLRQSPSMPAAEKHKLVYETPNYVISHAAKMVDTITEVINLYEQRVRSMQKVPLYSHGRQLLRSDGAPNKSFFHGLFNDHAMAIQFLKDIGFIRRTMQCQSCKRDMTWSERPDKNDRFIWRCQRRVAGASCNTSVSIRHGSWFQQSKLTLFEVLILTYDIVCRESASSTQNESGKIFKFCTNTDT
jgi:hypothetical protein